MFAKDKIWTSHVPLFILLSFAAPYCYRLSKVVYFFILTMTVSFPWDPIWALPPLYQFLSHYCSYWSVLKTYYGLIIISYFARCLSYASKGLTACVHFYALTAITFSYFLNLYTLPWMLCLESITWVQVVCFWSKVINDMFEAYLNAIFNPSRLMSFSLPECMLSVYFTFYIFTYSNKKN